MLVSGQDEIASQQGKTTIESDVSSDTSKRHVDPSNNEKGHTTTDLNVRKSDNDIHSTTCVLESQPPINTDKLDNSKSRKDQTAPREFTNKKESKACTGPIICPEQSSSERVHLRVSPSSIASASSLDSGYFSHTSLQENHHAISACKTIQQFNDSGGNTAQFQPTEICAPYESTRLESNSGKDRDTKEDASDTGKHLKQPTGQPPERNRKRQKEDNIDWSEDSKKSRCASVEQSEKQDEEVSSSSTGTCDSHNDISDGATCSADGDFNETRPKRKLRRTQYSKSDLRILNAYFAEDNWLSPIKQEALAKEMGYTDVQIKTWFQNKRASIYGTRQPKGKSKERSTSSNTAIDKLDHRLPTYYTLGLRQGYPIAVSSNEALLPHFQGSALSSNLHPLHTIYEGVINEFSAAPDRIAESQVFPGFVRRLTHSTTDVPSEKLLKHSKSSFHASNKIPSNISHETSSSSFLTSDNKSSGLNTFSYQNFVSNLPQASEDALVSSVDRVRSTYSTVDYRKPENNPFIAAFLNLPDRPHWTSPIFSPLIKPHVTPSIVSSLAAHRIRL